MPAQHSSRLSRIPSKTPNTIRKYRLQLGLTQREIAHVLGIRPATVSEWERGLVCPTTAALLRLAKALNTLAEALYPQFYFPRDRAEAVTHVAA